MASGLSVETYSPNTFIDSLGLRIGGTTYSASYPYYGPYQDSSSFSFDTSGSSNTVVTSGSNATQVTVPESGTSYPCEVPYDFVSGETFNGPVYSTDQLHVCGSPDFTGSPMSLTSGAPSTIPYLPLPPSPRDPNGSVLVTTQNSGTNGPYSVSLKGDYVPAGYTVDNVNCGGRATPQTSPMTSRTPLARRWLSSTDPDLPSLNTALAQYGTANPPAGTTGTGCKYSGPTMIELVTSGGGPTTMDVWSPLSTSPGTTSTCSKALGSPRPPHSSPVSRCRATVSSTCRAARGARGQAGSPTVQRLAPTPISPPSQRTVCCLEGDAYIEGELKGELTVASAANIIITRNLTYQCADGSGSASPADPSSVPGCTTESIPDILGLSAQYDVVVSHNQSGSNCTYDGTGTPTNTGTKISYNYPNDPPPSGPPCARNSTGSTPASSLTPPSSPAMAPSAPRTGTSSHTRAWLTLMGPT